MQLPAPTRHHSNDLRLSRAGRPYTGWASLTPTELLVVDLVAEGLTNAGVAGRLFVSPATVKSHLNHVFLKLGVANRTQLATATIERRRHTAAEPSPSLV